MTSTTAVARAIAEPVSARVPALRRLLRIGGLGSLVALYLCLVGIVPTFNERPLIAGIISLGQASLLMTYGVAGFLVARPFMGRSSASMIAWGAAGGALAGVLPALLVLVGSVIDIRAVFLHASPALYEELTRGLGTAGFWIPIAVGAATGALAGGAAGRPPGRPPVAPVVGAGLTHLLRPVRRPRPDPDADHSPGGRCSLPLRA